MTISTDLITIIEIATSSFCELQYNTITKHIQKITTNNMIVTSYNHYHIIQSYMPVLVSEVNVEDNATCISLLTETLRRDLFQPSAFGAAYYNMQNVLHSNCMCM